MKKVESLKTKLKAVNEDQFKKIENFISGTKNNITIDFQFEWQDTAFMERIVSKIKNVDISHYNYKGSMNTHGAGTIASKINEYISKYNSRKIAPDDFVKEVKPLIVEINEKRKLNENMYLRNSDVCDTVYGDKIIVIKGVGGIGKSHYLRDCQKEIEEKHSWLHLFLYGKYINVDTFTAVPWKEIIDYANENDFLLVIDAINEIDRISIIDFYTKIIEYSHTKCGRLVLSYRTHSMQRPYDKFATEEEYWDDFGRLVSDFNGVDSTTAIEQIVQFYKIDVSRIYNIIETSNPLLLNMLMGSNILTNSQFDKLINQDKKNITPITHIYERCVKGIIDKLYKNENVIARDVWNEIKNISKKLYDENINYFKVDDMTITSTNKNELIKKLIQAGIVIDVEFDGRYKFYFDQLSNALVARHAFKVLSELNTHEEKVEHIKSKMQGYNNFSEFLIYVVFELYSDNVEYALKLMRETKMPVDEDILANISFKDNATIQKVQGLMKIRTDEKFEDKLLITLGGLPMRVLNCENYLLARYLKRDKIVKLKYGSEESHILRRLKLTLNNINGKYCKKEFLNEVFCFAICCLYIPHKKINILASKIIYDVINILDCKKINKILDVYQNTKNLYVKSLIQSLAIYCSNKVKKKMEIVLNDIRDDKTVTNLDLLRNYSDLLMSKRELTLFDKVDYIKQYKKSVKSLKEEYAKDEPIESMMRSIKYQKLFSDLYLENYHEPNIMQYKMLNQKKEDVVAYNEALSLLFAGVENCNCDFEINHCNEYFKALIKITGFDEKKLLSQEMLYYKFYHHLKKTFETYDISADEVKSYKFNWGDRKWEADYIYEIIEFAVQTYVGSLLSNYFDNEPNVGNYKGYVHAGYSSEHYSRGDIHDVIYSSPINCNEEKVKELNKLVEDRIIGLNQNIKDKDWAKDSEASINNVQEMLKPYTTKDKQKWVLLSANIDYRLGSGYKEFWHKTLIISSRTKFKKNSLLLDRYKTDEYAFLYGSIDDYKNVKENKSYRVKHFADETDLTQETRLCLPPRDFITALKLRYDYLTATWKNKQGEDIIACDNNRTDYYHEVTKSGVYIREDVYTQVADKLKHYYYVYVDCNTGDARQGYHLIIKDGNILKQVDTDKGEYDVCTERGKKKKCKECLIWILEELEDRDRKLRWKYPNNPLVKILNRSDDDEPEDGFY